MASVRHLEFDSDSQTDRQTDRGQTSDRCQTRIIAYCPYARGGGIITQCKK